MMLGVFIVLLFVLSYLVFGTTSSPTKTAMINADAVQTVMLNLISSSGSQLTDPTTQNLNEELQLTLTSDNQALSNELQKVYGVKSVSNAEVQAVTNPDANGLITSAVSDSTLNATYSSLIAKYLASLDNYLVAAYRTAPGTSKTTLKNIVSQEDKNAVLLYESFSQNHPSN